MASATYQSRVLVIKRTKLGETDCICTLLSQDGSQIRAVAKGARKPTSPFTSRLELFSVCDVLFVKGKSLDIIKEARLVEGYPHLRENLEKTEAASPIAELLEKGTVDSLENAQLFALSTKALSFLDRQTFPDSSLLMITSAYLIKAMSFLGFKPQIDQCIGCGDKVIGGITQPGELVNFSFLEGGITCSVCSHDFETQWVKGEVIQWIYTLLYSTFEQILTFSISDSLQYDILRFLQQWIKVHLGYSLKSLTYIFSYGLQTSSCEAT